MARAERRRAAPRIPLPAALALGTVAALLPFLGKAYHIDDTIFLRMARQIAEHPSRPFDFFYPWGMTPLPAWLLYLNPPLDSYYLAAVGKLAREREFWTHLAYLPFAAACAAFSGAIARRLCRDPLPAAAAALVGPAFVVSATNVMADVPLLAFWLAGVWALLVAAEPGREGWLWVSAAAASAAAMTKYFGISLVPLSLVYWLALKRRPSVHWLSFLAAPAVLAAWSFYTKSQCGFHHPLASGEFALESLPHVLPQGLVTASFVGGGSLWPIALLATRPSKAALALAAAALAGAVLTLSSVAAAARPEWLILAPAGALLVGECATAAISRPNAESLLLTLWLFGTLAFAGLVNWTVNERALLPALLPAAILVARGMEDDESRRRLLRRWGWGLAPVLLISLLLAAADAGQADAGRQSAAVAAGDPVAKKYYIGHWGFQYYMDRAGAESFNYRRQDLPEGAHLYVFLNSSSVMSPGDALRRRLTLVRLFQAVNPVPAVLTDAAGLSAGFYSSSFGPVPFSFSRRRSRESNGVIVQSVGPASRTTGSSSPASRSPRRRRPRARG